MLDCIDNGFYAYPISHVLLPMMVSYYYSKGLNGALFAVTAAAGWETLEVLVKEIFGSYLIYGDSFVGEAETVCNVSLLDLGNGILGALLAYVTTRGGLKKSLGYWQQCSIFLVVGLLYAFFSGISWYCSWDGSCEEGEMVSFPWGNLINIVLLVVWIYFCYDDPQWILVNVLIISIFGTIPVLSSAIMVYIGTALCVTIQISYNVRIREMENRIRRTEYTSINKRVTIT